MAAMRTQGLTEFIVPAWELVERTGNIALEQLLVNLRSIGIHKYNLKILNEHCDLVSKALNFDIPVNMPIIGRDAFRTSSGIHASAITKLHRASDNRFADVVYSFMPPCEVGQQQIIDIGPNSGKANVIMWFEKHNVPYNQQLVLDVLEHAKLSNKVLSCEDVFRIINAEKTNAF